MNRTPKEVAKGRPKTLLARTLEERLAAYALCAGAAGVGMLALAPPADAQIIYTPNNAKVQCGPHVQGAYKCQEWAWLDLSHDGMIDFQLLDSWSNGTRRGRYNYFGLGLIGKQPGASVASTSLRAAELQPGSVIDPNQRWTVGNASDMISMVSLGSIRTCGPYGIWQDVKGGFLGLRLVVNGHTHYGWAEVTTEVLAVQPCAIRARLTGYAYNTVPDEPILAGQKSEDGVEGGYEVQPATLGALSLGSLGLDLWRTKRASEPEASAR